MTDGKPTKTRTQIAIGVLLALIAGITAFLQTLQEQGIEHRSCPPPAEQLYGWAGPEKAAEAYAALAPTLPTFRIVGAFDDDPAQPARLWELARRANDGKHLPRFRQEIGDCVGAGAAQGVQYLMAGDAAYDGRTNWAPLFVPYHYACGRMAPDCGAGNIRGPDGSVGSWQAEGIRRYGVLPAETAGLPPYSGRVAQQWATRMPESKWIELGKLHPVRTIARAESAADVRRALQNRYVATIASNYGTRTIRPFEGMQLAKWDASWPHQMCVIGYQQVAGKGYFYILNSWGDSAHPAPLSDEPPGGFWIPEADLERIVKQGDTWIFSDAVGFPARPIFPIFDHLELEVRVSPRPSQHWRNSPCVRTYAAAV